MSGFNQKYRPQTISELNLISVREGLGKVLASGEIPHAFLFTGPRGTGKTSAARIVAKAVNCQNNVYGKWSMVNSKDKNESINHKPLTINDAEPCNKCEQCLSITKGTNMDVLEIDAASNRGIDDIRELREKVKLSPASASFKVYIIDEVHMLTTEAFNALLKTLEEPPKHVIFILCTTEAEKLPETIISRCARINFKKAKEDEVVEKLKRVTKEEKLVVDDEALSEIAKGARGSFRDALNILEQSAFGTDKIAKDQVKEVLGHTTGVNPEKLLKLLVEKDIKGALIEINQVVENGGNLRFYTEGLLEILRGGLLAKLGVFEYEITTAETRNLTETLSLGDFKKLIELFSKASLELRDSIIPQLPLELAVVDWSEDGGNAGSPKTLGKAENQPAKQTSVETVETNETKGSLDLSEGIGSSVAEPSTNSFKDIQSETNSPTSLDEIKSRWADILQGVKPRNYSIEAFLRAARPVNFDNRILTIEVFYKFHRDKLDSDGCRAIIEEVASSVLRTPVNLKCVLSEKRITPINSNGNEAHKDIESVIVLEPKIESSIDDDLFAAAEKIFN
ncbi:MAG: DNA polymerase III subunit gamma/tau [Candidatus Curtissbacteria bacterium]|nr:DNA polymerase III subunit gamma/tau [Candidatus Curtissbacteria bacterium]